MQERRSNATKAIKLILHSFSYFCVPPLQARVLLPQFLFLQIAKGSTEYRGVDVHCKFQDEMVPSTDEVMNQLGAGRATRSRRR